MPSYTLVPHPDHPPVAATGVTVGIAGGEKDVLLTFRVCGAEKMVGPGRESPMRADGLWRTTCFELFLMSEDGRYVEFNFSPSTCWAAYAFDAYRSGMTPLARDVAPHVDRLPDGIEVDCDLGGLPHCALRMALSAVIEERGGAKSYWALAHAPGPPDFHNPACFTAMLSPPARA